MVNLSLLMLVKKITVYNVNFTDSIDVTVFITLRLT